MLPQERFGVNVRTHRKDRKLSQEALGDAAGLHFTEVSRLERGLREPRLGTIVRLAQALGVPVADLVAETDDQGPTPESAR